MNDVTVKDAHTQELPYCHEWNRGRLCTLREGHAGRHLDTVNGGDGWA